MFLCRETELRKMSIRYERKSFECIVIYGRRRVGKTALINEFIKDKPTIYFPALKTNAHGNLIALSKAIQTFTDPGMQSVPIFASYDDAFNAITRLAKTNERLILAIDEFPYLARSDDSIPSKLQHLIDHEWSDTQLFIILCGSSMSFMEKEVLSEKSPLFGRRTAQFKIQPLTYLDTASFHPELSNETNALIYGITGGIPHYINKLDVHTSIKGALIDNLFDTSSYLFEEPENLLKQELREPATYNSIITAIANGATRQNEIAAKTGIDYSICTKYLRTLIELGIIEKHQPMFNRKQKKIIYRISDHFFRFYYRFVPDNIISISANQIERIYDLAIGSYLSEYMGLIFEDMCRQYLIYYSNNLPFIISDIGEWWGTHHSKRKEIQVDIVATGTNAHSSNQKRQILIGSCKYKNELIDVDELELMHDYATAFTTSNDECVYYIFSKSGFTDALKEKAAHHEVTLISLDDLYATH